MCCCYVEMNNRKLLVKTLLLKAYGFFFSTNRPSPYGPEYTSLTFIVPEEILALRTPLYT
jgi:hypothetical protein